METYYVDGPVIYTTHPLRYLMKHIQTYMALQFVMRITYVGSIEDHELLLYLVITDKLDFRSKDSFNNKFKLFLTYEEVIGFCDQINQIVQPLVNTLYAGQQTQQYSILIKNRNLIFQGFIATNGQPMIKVTIMLPHEPIVTTVYMSLSKFQEFVNAINSIVRNWHNTLTTVYYQFDRLAKAMLHVHKDLLQKISALEAKLDQLSINSQQETIASPFSDSKDVTYHSCDTLTTKPQEVNSSIRYQEPLAIDDNTQEEKETSVSDFVMDQLKTITNKQQKQTETKPSLIPIEYIEDIKDLQPYFEAYSLSQLVERYKDSIKKLLIKYGIPETMIETDADILKVLMDIKTLLEGKPVNSMIGLMIQQALQEVG